MKTKNTNRRMPFDFMVGIECTQIVDVRPDLNPVMRELEQFDLMQHYDRWREDLDLIARLRTDKNRVTKVRWCIPWYRVEAEPGKYDFSWTDQVVDYANQLGIDLVVDLVHYGTPRWMPLGFTDPSFPHAVEALATACATRYKGKIRHWTPVNEPCVTAEFCAKRGEWPPYKKDDDNAYVAIVIAAALATQKAAKAIRKVDRKAKIWAAEAMGNAHPVNEEARPAAVAAVRADLIHWDLVHGRVDTSHPRYQEFLDKGATVAQVKELLDNAVKLDVLGLNFYPWGSRTFEMKDGEIQVGWKWDGRLLGELLETCWDYTGADLCVTETSAHGGGGAKSSTIRTNAGDHRIAWMDETMEAVEKARAKGVRVIGYTQFPLFTMIDWQYRIEEGTVQDYFINFGMIEVDAEFNRHWTPVADHYLQHMSRFEQHKRARRSSRRVA